MPDMSLIQNAVLGLQTAANIAKGLVHLNSMADVQLKVIDLQTSILSAQSSALAAQSDQFAMIERIHNLETEVAEIKAWEEEKQRYQMATPWEGFFVYALKESGKGTEPPHWICEHCYQEGRKAILQKRPNPNKPMFKIMKCSHCSFQMEMRDSNISPSYL